MSKLTSTFFFAEAARMENENRSIMAREYNDIGIITRLEEVIGAIESDLPAPIVPMNYDEVDLVGEIYQDYEETMLEFFEMCA